MKVLLVGKCDSIMAQSVLASRVTRVSRLFSLRPV